jgi:hypothetical protein
MRTEVHTKEKIQISMQSFFFPIPWAQAQLDLHG